MQTLTIQATRGRQVGLACQTQRLDTAAESAARRLEVDVVRGEQGQARIWIADTVHGADAHRDERTNVGLLVDPQDPEQWFGRIGAGTELLDASQPADAIERFLQDRLGAGGSDGSEIPPADRRSFACVDPGVTLAWITPYRVGLALEGARPQPTAIHVRHRAGGGTHLVNLEWSGGEDPEARILHMDAGLARAIYRAGKATRTVDTICAPLRSERPLGWHSPHTTAVQALLDRLVASGARATLGELGAGSIVVGRLVSGGPASVSLQLERELEHSLVGEFVVWTAAGGHRTLTARSKVVSQTAGTLALDHPETALIPDGRRMPRLQTARMPVTVDGAPAVLLDASASGMGLGVGPRSAVERGSLVRVRACGAEHTAIVVAAQPDRIGLRVIDYARGFRGRSLKVDERELGEDAVDIRPVAGPFRCERVEFEGPHGECIVGAWNESASASSGSGGILLVIPPSWGRTKETTSLLAQTLVANLESAGQHGAVLRIDYRHGRGESHPSRDPAASGQETLEFTLSGAAADIATAIDYGIERLSGPASVLLVGSSFSGPLCLRVATTHPGVTGLVQMMGAADLQDLIRLASGGIDVVAELRSGHQRNVLNVLGVLMRPSWTISDGIRENLVFLADAQADAVRLRFPILWVLGDHDAFVDPERVRSVVQLAPPGSRIANVRCGHVPNSSAEAVAAFLPVASWALEQAEVPHSCLVVPLEEHALAVMKEEYAAAPARDFIPAQDYWRRYMQGEEDDLGYEVLTLTPEYAQLMARQVEHLEPAPGECIADIGAGLGHLLRHLPPTGGTGLDVYLYDAVPELLVRAQRQSTPRGCRVHTETWDAATADVPTDLARCDAVIMSLFLTVLPDAQRFLECLHARLSPGTRIVASSMQPDADLSEIYQRLLRDAQSGALAPRDGCSTERLIEAIRAYVNDAADLLERAEHGQFTFYTPPEFRSLLQHSGFRHVRVEPSFGTPARAVIATALR